MFLRSILVLLFTLSIYSSCKQKKHVGYQPNGEGIENAEKAGVKLAIQSYTFRHLNLTEAIEATADLGLKYIEISPEHIIGGLWENKIFSFDVSDEQIADVKKFAEKQGVQIVGYGVFKTTEKSDWEKLFTFAEKLNLSYITCEPEEDHLDLIEELAKKSNVKINIHNSIESPSYSDPNILLEKIANRSPQIRICGDLGNWKRSGFDVIENLEKTNKHLGSVHLKDLCPSQFDDNVLSDCILNTGVLDIDDIIMTLRNQKFEGYLAIEYVAGETNPSADLKESISYFDSISHRLFTPN